MLEPVDIAILLLNKPITPQRLRKLERVIKMAKQNREDVVAEIAKINPTLAEELRK